MRESREGLGPRLTHWVNGMGVGLEWELESGTGTGPGGGSMMIHVLKFRSIYLVLSSSHCARVGEGTVGEGC